MTDWKEAAKQIAVGAVFGGVGGGMDAVYIEPVGAVLAACLGSLQGGYKFLKPDSSSSSNVTVTWLSSLSFFS